jgi:uncharacterized phage-associated protein
MYLAHSESTAEVVVDATSVYIRFMCAVRPFLAFSYLRPLFRHAAPRIVAPSAETLALATKLVFREDRATQAAAFFLKLNKKRIGFPIMRYIKLIKLMYLADREALLRLGHFITYDRLVSMDNGPVLSRVLNLIKGKASGHYWGKHISRWPHWWVLLTSDPSTDHLSAADEKILREIFEKYGRMGWRQLIIVTHDLPEWKDPHGSALTIEPREVLISQNVSADEADEIVADMVAAASL